ncbi:acetyltransferase (GNAT) family protein [Tamaricihabitans halophyticus]|uniref:Acetyltransferase (GNAT) family protein n=1 Tax=Tamaricihabitans halophyticus TaxID=1262583 RepID=A0A4R2QE15_9PSEU|nr:GNAT family N-acetyltransferase [Tamaricihabitans halophyticus]TCP47217.1 acetyltransferase (GNAT) family protein [Tamaricihabitans halophyticus]
MVTCRGAVALDTEAVVAIAYDAYAPYIERIGRQPAPMTADYAEAIAQGQLWVAESANGTVLGFLVLVEKPDHLLLENVAASPAAQGKGVGTALLALAERRARERGYARIRLYTNEAMTENLTYYPRHGYRETHRNTEDGFDRVHFVKEL